MADDKEDEVANNETRAKILSLQSENSRKREWLERLTEKKRALNDELRAREEDRTDLQDQIDKESRKQVDNRENRHADNSQDAAVGTFVEKGVKGLLGDRVPAFKDEVIEDDSDDDQGDGEAEAPDDGTKQTHDSVIVTYVAPNPQEREKLDEYRVTYRVDKDTTGTQLHEDACEFWGCSKDEFKLCQSEKGEPREFTSLELAKNITDDSILSKSKRAHLLLCHEKVLKDRKAGVTTAGSLDIEEIIKKQTAHEVDDSAVTSIQHGGKPEKAKDEDHYASAFQRSPGIHNLVKYNTANQPVKNWHRIRCGDILVYFLLGLFTCITISLRYQLEYYWLRNGVFQTVGVGVPGESSMGGVVNIAAYKGEMQYSDIWDWARGSFHYQMFNSNSTLQTFYVPMGFLRVRQQKSAVLDECLRLEILPAYRGGACHAINTMSSQDTQRLIIPAAQWINTSVEDSGRDAAVDPLTWTAEQADSANLRGYMQAYYTGSGYMVDYNLTNPNTAQTILEDMEVFKKVWLTKHTRVLIFEVLMANYNLGGFLSSSWVFEISASGAVRASQHIVPFGLGSEYVNNVGANVLDVFRGMLIFYIMTLQVVAETAYKVSMGGSGLHYICSFIGFIDASTVAIFVAMCYMRWEHDPPNPADMTEFYSYSHEATLHDRLFSTEGLFLFLVCIRYCEFMKLNPHIDQFWKTLSRSSTMFMHFMLIVAPLFMGTVIFANCIWSPFLYNFSTLWETVISLIFLIKQDYDLVDMYTNNPSWCIPFIVYYYLLMSLFCMNGFLAISVHSYFQVQLTDTSPKESRPWDFDQWMDWIMPGLLYQCVFQRPPGASKRENREEGDKDGEDEEDSDEDDDAKED